MPPLDIAARQAQLRRFAAERGWEPFQTPKNLAMAMVVEAAELLELFQWLTAEQSQAVAGDERLRGALADEAADVLIYLMQIADRCGVDLDAAVAAKIAKNALKYPVRDGAPILGPLPPVEPA